MNARPQHSPLSVPGRLLPVVLALGFAGCGDEPRPSRPPNLLLVSLDTLRADHLQPYGYSRETSPNLQRLADEGVVFEQCLATSNWTLPTHASLFTGLHPVVHGVLGPTDKLDSARATLGEALAEAGYATAGYYSNPFLADKFGYARGFETWQGMKGAEVFESQIERRGEPKGSVSRSRPPTPGVREDDYFVARSSEHVTDEALDFLAARDPQRPFALFLHYNDCHSDYVPPAPHDWQFSPDYEGDIDGERYTSNPRVRPDMDPDDLERIRALYDGEIAWVDSELGRVLRRLAADGLAEDTLVVVTADHGEGFFEHHHKEHHYGLFIELVHVPWILRLPGVLPAGRRVEHVVSQADIAPTILELLGLPPLPDADGLSWAAAAAGRPGGPRPRPVTSHTILKPLQEEDGDELLAWRNGRVSALLRRRPDGTERYLAFATESDPDETRPLDPAHEDAARAPALIAEALRELAARRAALAWLDGDEPLPEDPELLEQMRQWGYIK